MLAQSTTSKSQRDHGIDRDVDIHRCLESTESMVLNQASETRILVVVWWDEKRTIFLQGKTAKRRCTRFLHPRQTCASSETTSVLFTPSFLRASHQLCAKGRYAQLEDVITITPSLARACNCAVGTQWSLLVTVLSIVKGASVALADGARSALIEDRSINLARALHSHCFEQLLLG